LKLLTKSSFHLEEIAVIIVQLKEVNTY